MKKQKKPEYEKQRIIAEGEAQKAKIRVEQEKNQIQTVIQMETKKKEQDELVKMRKLQLTAKQLEAKAIKTIADAQAYERKALMNADGALQMKLDAYKEVNKYYASALKDKNLVPQIVIGKGGEGATNSSMDLINLLLAKTAKELSIDIKTQKKSN